MLRRELKIHLGIALGLLTTLAGIGSAQTWNTEFDRVPIDTVMPTGQSVAVDCQDEGADHPYRPYDWPDARATLEIDQVGTESVVTIEMTGARPDTYYTLWLRLLGTDASGETYGGNPLLGIPGTPLIPSSELDEALTFTGSGNAGLGLSNGFWSDANGNGLYTTTLDFPIIGGAYPFQNFEGFDATDARFPLEKPRAIPVAVVTTGAPFTLRIASHCQSNLNYGLFPGPHEGWFDWLAGGEAGSTAESVALSFLEARATWDAEAAFRAIAVDVESFDIQRIATLEDYRDAFAYYETVNWHWDIGSCEESTEEAGSVSCSVEHGNDWTRALELGPYPMTFHFDIQDRKIVGIYPDWNRDFVEDGLQVFLAFLRENHPEDYGLIYSESSPFLPRGEQALALLERYTEEFARSLE